MKQVNTIDISTIIFHELVGDWSQTIHLCSYNDDIVFGDVVHGIVNESFKTAFDGDSARDSLREAYPGVHDWQQLFDDLMRYHGGWPVDWSVVHTPFTDLPQDYITEIKKAGKESLFDIPFRFNYDETVESISLSLQIPYAEILHRFKVAVLQRVDKSYKEVFESIKADLPEHMVSRIDEYMAKPKAEIRTIRFEDHEWIVFDIVI